MNIQDGRPSLHLDPVQQNVHVWLPAVQEVEQEDGAEQLFEIWPLPLTTVVLQAFEDRDKDVDYNFYIDV